MKNTCILILSTLFLAGCMGGGGSSDIPIPPPEYVAIQDYERIASNANLLLSTDRINWVPGQTEPVRVSVECRDLFCSIGYTFNIRANKVFRLLPEETMVLPDTNGISTAIEHVVSSSIELHSYGGWLEYNFFATTVVLWKDDDDPDQGVIQTYGTIAGNATNTNPEVGATWTGFATARDHNIATDLESVVIGDASISVSLGEEVLADVHLTGLSNITTGQTYTDMIFEGMVVTEGQFSRYHADNNRLSGAFYGPEHEEVGGVFDHPEGLVGAYGASRSIQDD